MSRTWGTELYKTTSKSMSTLEGVVSRLNPKAKQAMYGAAMSGIIRRGTWDGCAFNKAGQEIQVGDAVRSSGVAAEIFGLPVDVVNNFIQVWDRQEGSDEECTERLRELIVKAGLFTDPDEPKRARILRETVYKSRETREREKFEAMVANLDLTDAQNEVATDIVAAAELLSVG